MVSATTRLMTIRRRKMTTAGKANKKERMKANSPAFPVHPEGYDPNAADAKRPAEAK